MAFHAFFFSHYQNRYAADAYARSLSFKRVSTPKKLLSKHGFGNVKVFEAGYFELGIMKVFGLPDTKVNEFKTFWSSRDDKLGHFGGRTTIEYVGKYGDIDYPKSKIVYRVNLTEEEKLFLTFKVFSNTCGEILSRDFNYMSKILRIDRVCAFVSEDETYFDINSDPEGVECLKSFIKSRTNLLKSEIYPLTSINELYLDDKSLNYVFDLKAHLDEVRYVEFVETKVNEGICYDLELLTQRFMVVFHSSIVSEETIRRICRIQNVVKVVLNQLRSPIEYRISLDVIDQISKEYPKIFVPARILGERAEIPDDAYHSIGINATSIFHREKTEN